MCIGIGSPCATIDSLSPCTTGARWACANFVISALTIAVRCWLYSKAFEKHQQRESFVLKENPHHSSIIWVVCAHAWLFGSMNLKSWEAQLSILMLTAREGWIGAQGKKPHCRSWTYEGNVLQTVMMSSSCLWKDIQETDIDWCDSWHKHGGVLDSRWFPNLECWNSYCMYSGMSLGSTTWSQRRCCFSCMIVWLEWCMSSVGTGLATSSLLSPSGKTYDEETGRILGSVSPDIASKGEKLKREWLLISLLLLLLLSASSSQVGRLPSTPSMTCFEIGAPVTVGSTPPICSRSLRTALCEPSDEGSFHKWYFPEAFRDFQSFLIDDIEITPLVSLAVQMWWWT